MKFWSQQRVVVTGGAGFLGSFVVEKLTAGGCTEIVVPRRRNCDLRDRRNIAKLLAETRPTMILHLAARVGGIRANREHPGEFFYDNAIMGIELLEQARQFHIHKVVVIGSICAYPKFTPVPFSEDQLWNGYPEETNAPYGIAKKVLLVQGQSYRQEFGLNSIHLLPVNLYGPRDNFEPERSHAIPAIIKKCVDARNSGAQFIECWGTGTATREFLYVEDAAEAIVLAAERYDEPDPVNIGSGIEISIAELVTLTARLSNFRGEIRWDNSEPDGQPRRCLDTQKAELAFGFRAKTSLETGLSNTIKWYEQQVSHASSKISP